jgi:hypothetical protein
VRTVTVIDPEGTTWRVRVVWQPRWRGPGPALRRLPLAAPRRPGRVSSFDLGDNLLIGLAVIVG